jgi:hypothetical protein
VKLERQTGGVFTAWHSDDGWNWTDVNDDDPATDSWDNITMAEPVYVGLCVTSHNSAELCTADFNDVHVYDFFGFEILPGVDTGSSANIGNNDAEPMYVALKDGSGTVGVVHNSDANAATVTGWTEWPIALSDFGVDLSDVEQIYIGLGDRSNPQQGGGGVIYVDDIRVCPSYCVPEFGPTADLTGDCLVSEPDLDLLTDDWLEGDYTIYPVAPNDAELLVHWKFDEGFGTTAGDSSGNGRDGDVNGPTWVASGGFQNSGCLEFSGLGDIVLDNDANTYLNGHGALTVSMWIKSDLINTDRGFIIAEPPVGGDKSITMRYDAAGASHGGTNVVKMGISTVAGSDGPQLESSENLQATSWQHVCMTWSSGDIIRFYVNGAEDTPTGRNNEYQVGTTAGNSILVIGKGGKDGAVGQSWDGLIDDVRIYSYALSHNEVLTLADASEIYVPLVSVANFYDEEPANFKKVNFRDYAVMMDEWLEEKLWP